MDPETHTPPIHHVPGVEASPDKLLQSRPFSYPDTQRHRLGPNFALLPVNRPRGLAAVRNYQRDGLMRLDGNGGAGPNYEPNSRGGPRENPAVREVAIPLQGHTGRTDHPVRADDFEQPGLLYKVMTAEERTRLLSNLAGHMRGVDPAILARQLGHFVRADEGYGTRLAELVGVPRTNIP